jgi:hypothetical protein
MYAASGIHILCRWPSCALAKRRQDGHLQRMRISRGCIHVQLTSLTSWRWADDARNIQRNLILFNLYKNCVSGWYQWRNYTTMHGLPNLKIALWVVVISLHTPVPGQQPETFCPWSTQTFRCHVDKISTAITLMCEPEGKSVCRVGGVVLWLKWCL